MKNKKNWRAWLFLTLGLLITIYITLIIKSNIDKIAETEFMLQSKELSSKIMQRLQAHEQILQSSAAFFKVSDTMTRKQWKDFVEHSKINTNFPGILGLGFSLIIPEDNLEKHILQFKKEGFPDYKVFPEVKRDNYTSIIFLEPFSARNLRAFGYDMMTDLVRREAMERARDMNIAALSGKVLLVQETVTDVQAGNLMYVPVYRKGAAINSLKQRREAIIGWVYSPYRMNDLMSSIMKEWDLQNNKKLYLHIFDGTEYSPQSMLFESHEPHEQSASENIRFSNQIPIKFNGHQWLLIFSQQTGNIITDYISVWSVLLSGLIISFLLFFFTKSLVNTNFRARHMATRLTAELKESERFLKESQKIANLGSYSLDLTTGIWKSSEILDEIFGINKSYVRSIDGWNMLIHPDHKEMMVDYFKNEVIIKKKPFNKEYRIVKNNTAKERWVHGLGKLEFDNQNNPIRMIGTISDITERKLAEEKSHLSREQYKSLFENSPLGIYQTKPDGTIMRANTALLKMLEFDSLSDLQKRDLNKEGYSEQSSVSRQQFAEMMERDGFVNGLEESWTTKSGKIIPIRENARVIKTKNGETLFYEGTVEDITERKLAEERLRLSEERFTLAVGGSKDGLWDWNIVKNKVYFSPRWKSMLGYKDEELENKFSTWENLLHPDDIEHAKLSIQAYFNKEIPKYEIEFRMLHKDGNYRWILARAEVLRNEEGKPYRMAGSHTDITEHKNIEKELKESEKRLQSIVETAPIPLIITKVSDSTIILANESLSKLFNIPVTKAIGNKTPDFYYNPDDRDKLLKTFFKNGFVDNYEIILKKLDDSPIYCSVSLKSMTLNNEQVIITGFHDITDHKKAEKKIKDLNENLENLVNQRTLELQETKNRSEYLLTSAPVVIFTLEATPPFKTTFMGENIHQMVGYTTEQFLEDPNFWERKIHPDDAHYIVNEMPQILEKGNLTLEYRFLQNDGTYKWMSDSLIIAKNDQGKPIEILGYWIDITDRKNDEETLRLSESRFRDVALSTSDFVWEIDAQGRYTYCSKKVIDVLGYTSSEIIGKTPFDLMHPEEIESHSAIFKDIVQNKKPIVDLENLNIAKNGSSVMLLTNGVPVLDKEGNLLGFRGVNKNITHQKQAEEEYRAIIQTAVDGFWIINSSGEIIDVNNAYCEMIGYSRDELLSKKISDIEAIEKPEEIAKRIKTIITTGSARFEATHRRKDGTLMDVQVSTQFSKARGGVFIAFVQDITKRKESEKRIQETLKEISDYKYAMDESGIVVITDQKGIIRYTNDLFCEISQYTREELIGKDHRIINSGFHPKEFFKDLWRTITVGKIWKGEVKNKAKDGSFYWVYTVIVPFLNKKGKPYQYVTIRRDITEEKQLSEELINSKEAADAANRSKSEFLANMSHEIRTPMNAIIGFSELLYNTMENEKQRSQIESIRSSGKNLLKIINDILDLSKIEAGKLSLQTETVNIHKLSKDIEMMFEHRINDKNISFFIETESQIPNALLLDETRLRQILFNLIGNAFKFTDKGQVILSLDKKSKGNNLIDLIIKVEDTGIGIPKNQHEKIFETFNQQEGQLNSKYGGTGLGLTITKRLIEMMGGKISVNSTPNKGSIFTVYLPDVKIGEIDDLIKTKITFDPTSVIFKNSKVLVVDDNIENRNLITSLLENSPLTIFKAENGKEAVEIATQNLPDLILMDLRMPVMNGYEATQILKAQNSTKSIPIISISASTKVFSKKGDLKNIFNDSLMKPIDLSELLELLKKYLKYKIVKRKTSILKNEPNKIKLTLSSEQLKYLPELIQILENEFMPTYNDAIKTQMIDQIEKFGKDLVVFAKKSKFKSILDYGHEICRLADNFEIDKLITTLNKFPEIIKQHKSLINNS